MRIVKRKKLQYNSGGVKLLKLARKGIISHTAAKDWYAKEHGFKGISDLNFYIRKSVMFMIQLGLDFSPDLSLSVYDILKSLNLNEIKDFSLKCACCGETRYEFLTIDHVHNNGAEHKKINRIRSGTSMYKYLLTHGFKSSDYQILCSNCNCSLGFYGYCPHNPEIRREVKSGKSNRNYSNKNLLQKR